MAEADAAAHLGWRQRDRVGRVLDVCVDVEVLEDAVEECQRALHLHLHVEQLAEREEETRLERRERDDLADRRCARRAGEREVAGEPIHQRRHDREDRADDHEEPAADHALAQLEPRKPRVGVAVSSDRLPLAPERLREQDPAHAERLLGDRAHLGERFLGLSGDATPDLADSVGQEEEERQQRKRQQRQAPVDQDHRDHGADDHHHVGSDAAGRIGDHALDATDVVGKAALDLAGLGLGEEAQRQSVQVLVQGVAQVLHHVLADDVVEVRLADADQAGDDRRDDHQGDEHVEQEPVLLRQGHVDDLAEQDRVHQAEQARDDDREEDDHDLEPVGPEEARDATRRRAGLSLAYCRWILRGRAHHPAHAPARAVCPRTSKCHPSHASTLGGIGSKRAWHISLPARHGRREDNCFQTTPLLAQGIRSLLRSRHLVLLASTALLVAACGAASATGTPAPAATPANSSGAVATQVGESATPAGPTPTATPTVAPSEDAGATSGQTASGGITVTVVLTGGQDAGTYTGVEDPNCTVGLIGPQAWGVQWSTDGGPKQLSSVQLVSAAPGKADDPSAMFQGTVMLLSIGVGPLLQGNTYEIDDKTDNSQDQGSGSVQVQDNGDTAVIHATGTTKDGVGVDATINCPSVSRT